MSEGPKDSRHTARIYAESQLAEVVSVDDPDGLNRVRVRLLSFDGVGDQDGPIWARVAVPFAGPNRGAFFFPDVGDEVLVSFVGGDARYPVVVGALWNGGAEAPESLGGSGDSVDRWTIVGKAGTRVAIVEEQSGSPTIALSTPGGVELEMTDQGSKIEMTAGGATVKIEPSGVTVETSAQVQVNASTVKISAALIDLDAPMVTCTSIVQCQTLMATTVVASTYTPGAGNIW